MNKICIDTKVYNLTIKENQEYEITNLENDSDISITILDNVTSTINFLVKNSKVNITINLLKNSNLIVNKLGINASININSFQKDFSNLKYNFSILTNIDSVNNIKISSGNSSKCIFNTNGINLNSNKLFFIIDGIIDKDSLNVYLEENSKIINLKDGNSKIVPNLIVDNKEVIANHSAYIGKFDDNLIWYLNSRGINTDDAKKMLFKGLIFGNMENYQEEFFMVLDDII